MHILEREMRIVLNMKQILTHYILLINSGITLSNPWWPSNADKGGLYLIVVIKKCSGKYIPVPGSVFLVQHVDIDDPPYPDTPAL